MLFQEYIRPPADDVTIPPNVDDLVVLQVPGGLRGSSVNIQINNIQYAVPVPTLEPQDGTTTDQLFNGSMGYLRMMMDFMVLDDIIHSGDITRLPAMMKRLAPTFIGLTSYKSKYALECINFVTKVEWILSEKERTKVLLRAFINTIGRQGKNKPADMQQENNIKTVKTV